MSGDENQKFREKTNWCCGRSLLDLECKNWYWTGLWQYLLSLISSTEATYLRIEKRQRRGKAGLGFFGGGCGCVFFAVRPAAEPRKEKRRRTRSCGYKVVQGNEIEFAFVISISVSI